MSVLLYDSKGKPVFRELEEEVVTSSTASVRSPFDENVISSLNVKSLQSLLQQAAQGDTEKYLLMASQMEQRDPHYFSVLQTRKLSVAHLPRMVIAPTDRPSDVRLAEKLTALVNRRGFTQMLIDAMDAVGKGFSVQEILWRQEDVWTPEQFIFRKQHWFQFDRETGSELRIRESSRPDGIKMHPYKYIVHSPSIVSGHHLDGGLARQVAAMHLFKAYALKSWMAFAEVFGMPIRIGKYPPNADGGQKAALKKALTSIGADACAIIPTTMEIVFERAAASGFAGSDEFFVRLTDWLDRQVSKAVLGQNMIDEDGGSYAKSQTLQLVREDIRNSDARQLEDTINRDLIEVYVDLNYGKRPLGMYPKFRIETEPKEDLLRMSQAIIPFIDRGLTVESSVIRDKFNIPEPANGADIIQSTHKYEPQVAVDDPSNKPTNQANYQQKYYEVLQMIEDHTNMREFKRSLTEKGVG